MRKQSGQVHSRESSATLQLTVSLLYPLAVKNFTPSLDNVILFIKHPERSLILNAEIYYG